MNLVQTAALVKKVSLILAGILGIYISFLIIRAPISSTWLTIFPPKNLPNTAFGTLAPIEFSEVSILTSNPEYVLNTQTGRLPADLDTVMNVYKYVEPAFSFSEGERAQRDAATLGFTDNMRISDLSKDVFVWQDVAFGGNLKIDTTTRTLELTTPLSGLGSLFPAGQLTQATAIEEATFLLQKINRLSDKLYTLDTRGYQEVRFGKFGVSGVIEANSIPEAQIARVDFFRNILDYPILGPNPSEGLLQVFLRAPQRDRTQVENPQLNYPVVRAYHWEVNTDQIGTYPIIPVDQIWEQVRQNLGVVASVVPNGSSPFATPQTVRVDRILVNDIYLAYFDDNKPQEHMQPIYVFEGNYTASNGGAGTITIYYPAISSEYVSIP